MYVWDLKQYPTEKEKVIATIEKTIRVMFCCGKPHKQRKKTEMSGKNNTPKTVTMSFDLEHRYSFSNQTPKLAMISVFNLNTNKKKHYTKDEALFILKQATKAKPH